MERSDGLRSLLAQLPPTPAFEEPTRADKSLSEVFVVIKSGVRLREIVGGGLDLAQTVELAMATCAMEPDHYHWFDVVSVQLGVQTLEKSVYEVRRTKDGHVQAFER